MLVSAIEEAQDVIETPDHAYTYIVRALDGLANIHKVTQTRLADSLPATCAQMTRQILFEARDKLKKEERNYRKSGDTAHCGHTREDREQKPSRQMPSKTLLEFR